MKIKLLVCLLVVLFTLPAVALPPRGYSSDKALGVDNSTYIDVNRVLMFVTNHGNFGRDLAGVFGNDYGTYWPFAGDIEPIHDHNALAIRSPLYAGGLWIGGIDEATGEVRLALSEYASEYTPGPMIGGTFAPDQSYYRTFKLYKDSLADNPNQDYLDIMTYATMGTDTVLVPLNDEGELEMVGDQMCWSIFNDADPAGHTGAVTGGETDPLGIEVRQTVFGYDREDPLGDMVFVRWRIVNKGGNTINDCYISMWADPDLGGSGDDLVGVDTILSLGYCYNAYNNDTDYEIAPAMGYDFFQGPLVDGDPSDTGKGFGTIWPGEKNLGAVSFNKYINGTDPDNFTETYLFMQGLDGKSGDPYIYQGDTLLYMYSGDPVKGTGDLDDTPPADRRYMISTGPITFAPGDSTEILAAVLFGMGGDRLSSISVLKYYDRFAQSAYDVDFNVASPPASPVVEAAQLSDEIVLSWGNISEVNHGDYPFQGYTVYQGVAATGPWTRIGNFDVNDGVAQILDEVLDPNTGALETRLVKNGSDNGVARFFVVDRDHLEGGGLNNISEYYFRVEAYSYDPAATPKTLTSADLAVVIPQAPIAGTHLNADAQEVLEYTHPAGGSNGSIIPIVIDPYMLTGDDYQVTFTDDGEGGVFWNLINVTTSTTLLSGQPNESGDDDYPIVDGFMIKVLGPAFGVIAIDEVADAAGPIEPDNVMWSLNSTRDWYIGSDDGSNFDRMNWRHHIGTSDWEIRFTATGSEYYDFGPETLWGHRCPFEFWNIGIGTPDDPSDDVRIQISHLDDDESGGWSYGDRIYPTEVPYSEPHPAFMDYVWDADFLIGRIVINDYSEATTQPAEGTIIRFTTAKVNTVADVFAFSTEAPSYTASETDLDAIKTVPNPFYLYGGYDPSPGSKRIAFHHLPATCKITIFNLAGDQIRVIDKDDASTAIEYWDVLTETGLPVASGIYIYVVEADGFGTKIGKMAVFVEAEVLQIF